MYFGFILAFELALVIVPLRADFRPMQEARCGAYRFDAI